MSCMSDLSVRFGPFRFDFGRRELWCNGKSVRIGSRSADILSILATAKGAVVSKDDLLTEIWPRQVVEENTLQVHVSALRKALDANDSGQSHLMTVPGRGYRLLGLEKGHNRPTLPDRPSIAVLPFENRSAEPGQEYFADGIVEDIITALCSIRWLFVIARNSSFSYGHEPVDVREVGRELGVRYVLKGSVRKSDQRVRIAGQLLDAESGVHLWADHFDGAVEDIFDLPDQVTASVVGAIAPKLEKAEIERAKRKPTESLDAYDYFLRGLACAHRMTRDAVEEALQLFSRATEIDPDFASPYGVAAFCYVMRKMNGWTTDRSADVSQTIHLARRAAQFGEDDALSLAFAGLALGYVAGELDEAAAIIDRATKLDRNLAIGWYASGTTKAFRGGEPDVAIEHLARAMRLSPLDPLIFTMQGVTAVCHFLADRYEEAMLWAERAFLSNPNILGTLRIGAASYARANRPQEARNFITRALELDPEMRVSNLTSRIGYFRRQQDYAKYVDALRQAGLPD
jgi:TolB-like protein/tetratricopeptide (TPR) repeat protein